MAKDPTLQNALDQHQSLLFRLPRELRDEIYHYYSQANGYYYDSTSGTLRMDGGESIDLSLQYTCKRTAAEMQGIALGINKITFRTMVDLPRPSDQLMKSQVFDHYIRKRRRTILSRMVEWTYPLVTDETMRQLCERHPANLAVKKMRELHREGDSDGPLAGGHLWGDNGGFDTVDYDEYSAEAIVILRDLLDIISTDPGFWHMTASDFDVNARRAFFVATEHWATRWDKFEDYLTEHIPVYTSKAEQQQVLQWQPDSWFIPTDDDLEALEEFLPHDENSYPFHAVHIRGGRRSYFSAAAVAIRFLSRLSESTRSHLRWVTILEDECSDPESFSHARGLVPFCIFNTQLEIERRVDIWRTSLIGITRANHWYTEGRGRVMREIGMWISEAKALTVLGMPPGSYNLVLHGPSPLASQQICDATARVAIWDEGCRLITKADPIHGPYFDHMLGEGFADAIKGVIEGNIPARFDADMGKIWDIDQLLRDQDGDWPEDLDDVFELRNLEEPPEGWCAAHEERFGVWKHRDSVRLDWTEYMEGVEMLFEAE
ncbi:uncharacterized protein J4E84_005061 [Alternaria hordeiaustralica]|uniref:uncharacterized protein n=1 Tax=Alternaria hordeiaustralica TaxID=1187925 RepID=UPI0020C4727A|nr:uncharacterized protein J4E84_005061 [Alternaria hordeiaustralica]KAI4688133.1 hypothetical protein J4E84_005061 [Alternaria hordeiaustralica]